MPQAVPQAPPRREPIEPRDAPRATTRTAASPTTVAAAAAPSLWEPPAEADDEEPILETGVTPAERGDSPSGFLQLFVNVGKREGVRPSDLQKLFADKGLAPEDTTRIRVRDRMTFVSVRKEIFDQAVAALAGEVIGGRKVVAELARGRG